MSVSRPLNLETRHAAVGWIARARSNAAQTLALVLRAPRGRARLIRQSSRIAAGAAIAVLMIVGMMLLVDRYTVAIATSLPRWLQIAFAEVSDFGKSGWFLVPIGGVLLLMALRTSPALARTMRLVLLSMAVRLSFLFVAIALPSLFTGVLKRIIGRARPFVDLAGDPFHYLPFSWRADYASMPSGHATTAVAAAVAIGFVSPRLRVPLWIYALIILASRVVLAAHYPSDVLAGALVGAVGVCMVRDWFAARRLVFTIDAQGRVRSLPGPSLARIMRVAHRLLAP